MSSIQKKWRCGICTLKNKADCEVCATCGCERPTDASSDSQPATSVTVWEWKGGEGDDDWFEYSAAVSAEITANYNKGVISFNVSIPLEASVGDNDSDDDSDAQWHCCIDLSKMQQLSLESGRLRDIRRVKWQLTETAADCSSGSKQVHSHSTSDSTAVSSMHASADSSAKSSVESKTKQSKRTAPKKQSSAKKRRLDRSEALAELSSDSGREDAGRRKKRGLKRGSFMRVDSSQSTPPPLTAVKAKAKRKRKLWEVSALIDSGNGRVEDSGSSKKRRRTFASDSLGKAVAIGAKHVDANLSLTDANKQLIDALLELSVIERNSANVHKANAYAKAVKSLKNCGFKVTNASDARKLEGVGKKIAAKIGELLETGHLTKLDALRGDKRIQAINSLCLVHGIGPKKASELYSAKVESVAQLRAAVEKKPHLLSKAQTIGLKYLEDFQCRIPREEVAEIRDAIESALSATTRGKAFVVEICGSFRRGKKSCGDIDVLLTAPKLSETSKDALANALDFAVSTLRKSALLKDDLSHGKSKYMGVCRLPPKPSSERKAAATALDDSFAIAVPTFEDGNEESIAVSTMEPVIGSLSMTGASLHCDDSFDIGSVGIDRRLFRRIDIAVVPYNTFFATLLYFTGSDELNREMRVTANEMGLVLNESGLYELAQASPKKGSKKGRRILIPKSEKEIFEALHMKYLEPTERG